MDTEMERGQLLSLSALSSDSLPAVTASEDNVALQPMSRLQGEDYQGSGTVQRPQEGAGAVGKNGNTQKP